EAYFAQDQAEEAIITLEPLLIDPLKEHPATFALAHAITGRAYHRLGDIGNALDHLEIGFAHEPDEHLKSLVQEEIAAIQLEVGQPAEAVESLRGALPLINRADHPDVLARCLTTLAHTLGGLNRYAEAISVYEEALSALRDVAGVAPTHTADVLRSLGQTHEAQGQRSEASQAYRRALNLLERTDAPRQKRDILHMLARVTAEMGDQSAVQLYEQVRDATAAVGEPGELGNVLRELADVHRDGGRLPLAVQNYQAALDHQPAPMLVRDRLATLRNLGRAFAQMERYDDARTAWTEALDLSGELPDSSPLEIGLTYHAIAEAHRLQTHYDDAKRNYHEALQHLAARSVESAETWRKLGLALHAAATAQTPPAAGQLEAAINALQKALEAEKAQPQQVNARLVDTLHHLARVQEDADNLDAAITRYHEALVYMDRDLQPIRYADTLRTLGQLYSANRAYPQALKALNEALEIEGNYVPRSDDRVSRTLQMIAETHRASGDLEKAAECYQQVTVYANYARRVSDDLRDTLSELERRRATLQAAQQSLALLDRSDTATVKDIVFVHALIAHAHARLNQPQQAADTINTLLNVLDERGSDLNTDDRDGDTRALAWLFTASAAERDNDIDTAQFACGAALETVRNANLRWVIEQWARSLAG
ncbi:MAG: tetratricopeptide repeat protein, partial [Anaerolineae bacterium]|nr:tetratricopeptide repeat protein [Anaerolineae bacterium]